MVVTILQNQLNKKYYLGSQKKINYNIVGTWTQIPNVANPGPLPTAAFNSQAEAQIALNNYIGKSKSTSPVHIVPTIHGAPTVVANHNAHITEPKAPYAEAVTNVKGTVLPIYINPPKSKKKKS